MFKNEMRVQSFGLHVKGSELFTKLHIRSIPEDPYTAA